MTQMTTMPFAYIFIGATIPIQAADKRVLMEGHHDKGLVENS